jgi:micrococcal nuclease
MRLTCALLAIFSAFPAHAAERMAGPVEAEVVRVVDGDTLVARARIWLGQTIETHVRLAGIDAPELRGKCLSEKERARAARDALARLVGEGPVMLADIESDKFGGRVLARVRTSQSQDVATAMIAEGYARAYAGGRRMGWCGAPG